MYKVIGVMSGTSCDGLDIAYCNFWKENQQWFFKLLYSKTYTNNLWEELAHAHTYDTNKLAALDFTLGKTIGDFVNQFITEHRINREEIHCIASHGHTILHNPKQGYTLQIGNGNAIKAQTAITTIFDFRAMDVALGGQGAPLVPIGDELLFNSYNYCLNLGGIANYSYNEKGIRKAKDICYVGIVLNRLTALLGMPYDDKGSIAKSSNVNEALLKELVALDFNNQSLGIEQYEKQVVPLLNKEEDIYTKIATCTEYAAIKIGEVLEANKTVFVTGGGAFNTYLLERISFHSHAKLVLSSNEIINYKEAIIFGFLGVLKMENIPNCLASVTGASRDNIGGVVV